jgi:hypothetical protein
MMELYCPCPRMRRNCRDHSGCATRIHDYSAIAKPSHVSNAAVHESLSRCTCCAHEGCSVGIREDRDHRVGQPPESTTGASWRHHRESTTSAAASPIPDLRDIDSR